MDKKVVRIFWIANLLTLAIVAFFLAGGAGRLFVGGSNVDVDRPRRDASVFVKDAPSDGEVDPWQRGRDAILERHLFESAFRIGGPALEQNYPLVPPPGDGPTMLCSDSGIRLLGIVAVLDDQTQSAAAVDDGKKSWVCNVGDTIGTWVVSGMTWRYLILTGAEDQCVVDLFETGAGKARGDKRPSGAIEEAVRSISDTEKVVARDFLMQVMADPFKFAKHASVRPHKVNGNVDGFELKRFNRNGPVASLGAEVGDVIHSVNGVPLTDLTGTMEALSTLGTTDHFTLSVTRNGKPLEINVAVN